MHDANSFVTFTISDKNMPKNQSLDVEHWQKFAKRLRKTHKFRFYHCGEYGDDTSRAHYHALLFGLDFRADRKFYRTTDQGHKLYTSEFLDKTWKLGQCQIGDLTAESAAYVSRYAMKKQTGQFAEGYYDKFDIFTGEVHERKAPYVTMSRRPGIGKSWLDKYQTDVYPSDEVIVKGRPTRPPKYYDAQQPEDELALLKKKRQAKAATHASNNTPDRLRVREHIHLARMCLLPRNLDEGTNQPKS